MTPARPTLFISYASEDRDAARLLRDALVAAGIDVWYDENELGGGDAWDQKIRRQIRDCDYFMPVISATTERRKEGYFRREWRLAVERSLDMADDVMFLLPICLDDTNELHARVPEKFTTVQWLRVPGGVPTPALAALLNKVAHGDHAVPPILAKSTAPQRPPRAAAASSAHSRSTAHDHHDGPPPMPPFPHMADKGNIGHGFKFMAEVIWWGITAAWLLLKRAPRWIRIVLSIWFVFFLVAKCNRSTSSDRTDEPAAEKSTEAKKEASAKKAAASKSVRDTIEKLSKLGQPKDNVPTEKGAGGFTEMGSELARGIVSGLKGLDAYGKQIVVVPFAVGGASEADSKTLGDILAALYGHLAVKRPDETAVNTTPLATFDDQALTALGNQIGADYVLSAQFLQENGAAQLDVRLVKSSDGSVAWKSLYPLAGKDPATLGNEIANAVLEATPAK